VVFSPAVATRNCSVTITDVRGVKHTVEVAAESVYEAGVLGLAALKRDSWIDRPGRAATLEVAVCEPPVKHIVTVAQIERWLEGATSGTNEKVRKDRLKEMLRGA
jgi:hypothetical protein